jgi:hypothetical protein
MNSLGAILQDRESFVSSYVSLTWGNRGVEKEPVMKVNLRLRICRGIGDGPVGLHGSV